MDSSRKGIHANGDFLVKVAILIVVVAIPSSIKSRGGKVVPQPFIIGAPSSTMDQAKFPPPQLRVVEIPKSRTFQATI